MKKILLLATVLGMASGLSLANTANLEIGKSLFENPTLGGGNTGKSCNSCHAGGKDLRGKTPSILEMNEMSLAGIVNSCIEKALGGSAIDPNGQDMRDLMAYMRTLVPKTDKVKPRKMEGC